MTFSFKLAYDSIDTQFVSVLWSIAIIMCPALPDPDNGMVTWDNLAPGGIATYTCDSGFILVGDPTRNCGSDGTWSGEEPTCDRKLLSIITACILLHNYCILLLSNCNILHIMTQ